MAETKKNTEKKIRICRKVRKIDRISNIVIFTDLKTFWDHLSESVIFSIVLFLIFKFDKMSETE